MKNKITDFIKQSLEARENLIKDTELHTRVERIIFECVNTFKSGGRILFCGNGGSASDAQHLAAELSGRYKFDRAPLDAEALNVNTSYLTAVANDYSFDVVYSRLVEAKGREGDVLFAISTSGNSENILNAIESAKAKKMKVVGFTGKSGGKMKELCDLLINVPSNDTPIIQEMHILLGHYICEQIEIEMFKN